MPQPPVDVQAVMLDRLRLYAARNPRFGFLHSDLLAIAALCHGVLPAPRPTERNEGSARSTRRMRERAAALAEDRSEAEKGSACPPEAPSLPSDPADNPPRSNSRPAALQRLRADPKFQLFMPLVAEGLTNRQIGDKLGFTKEHVNGRVRRWLALTEQDGRMGLAAWARRNGALDDTGAGQ